MKPINYYWKKIYEVYGEDEMTGRKPNVTYIKGIFEALGGSSEKKLNENQYLQGILEILSPSEDEEEEVK